MKNPAQDDNEKIIERLREEIIQLKSKIHELEKENSVLKRSMSNLGMSYTKSKEDEIRDEPYLLLKPQKDDRKSKNIFTKIEKTEEKSEPVMEPDVIEFTPNLETPIELEPSVPALSSMNKPIIEGYSRRECPICGNNRHMFIHEEIDKTNIVLDYPRIYGKKYKCGKCGGFWKISPTLE